MVKKWLADGSPLQADQDERGLRGLPPNPAILSHSITIYPLYGRLKTR